MAFSIRPKGSKTVDPVAGQHLFSVCWLAASLGSTTLQLRLLAQALSAIHAWGASHYQGTLIAGLALAWMIGTLFGRPLSQRAQVLTWGIWLLAVSIAWLAAPLLGLSLSVPLARAALQLAALAVLCVLIAFLSTAWIRQERPWPSVGEGTAQLHSIGGIVGGLVLTWLLPDWAGSIATALLLPLLLLDMWPPARCPLVPPVPLRPTSPPRPERGRYQYSVPESRTTAQSNRPGWWWSWLSGRGQLALTLLGSSTTVILTSVWLVVPSLFTLELAETHTLNVLLWLLCGQICAFLLGACVLLTRSSKRLLGARDLRIAPAHRSVALVLGWVALLIVAVGLAGLGNPWNQAPWFLAVTIAGLTLGDATWYRIYPRLLSSLASERSVMRRYSPWTLPNSDGVEDLAAFRRERDEQAQRCVSHWETGFQLAAVALTGLLSDQWGFDPVLVLAGGVLLGTVGLAVLAGSRMNEQPDAETLPDQWSRVPRVLTGTRREEHSANGTLHGVSHTAQPVPLYGDVTRNHATEPTTTAQHPVILQNIGEERLESSFAAKYTHLPLDGEEHESGHTHEGNGNGIH